jgi:hypothetical protein
VIGLAIAVLAASPASDAAGRALALVAVSPSSEERLEQARARVPGVARWLSDPRLRNALEGFERRPTAAQRAREALASARERLRSLDVAGVRRALGEARTAAGELAPAIENHALAAEIAVEQAQLELLERDPAAAQQMLLFALSAEPGLTLDPARYPPSLGDALARARGRFNQGAPAACRIETSPAGATVDSEGVPGSPTPLTASLRAGPQILWIHKDGLAPKVAWEVVGAECRFSWALEPADEAERLQPFVDAVRQNEGERRRAAAEALAEVLGVDGVAVLPAAGLEPMVYLRNAPLPPPLVEHRDAAWYRDGWGDVLAGAGVLALGGAAVSFGAGERQAQLTQATGGDYPNYWSHRQSAQTLRMTGGVMAAAGGVALAAAIVRYLWLRPRVPAVSVALSAGGPTSFGLTLEGALGW